MGDTNYFYYKLGDATPTEARLRYGNDLKKLLGRHKVEHLEVEEVDENGRFMRYRLEVGGPSNPPGN